MDYLNNMFSLKGNIALVTGGSYGIGFAIAKALARAGAVIAFNCRSQEHLDQALKDYEKEGNEKLNRRQFSSAGKSPARICLAASRRQLFVRRRRA